MATTTALPHSYYNDISPLPIYDDHVRYDSSQRTHRSYYGPNQDPSYDEAAIPFQPHDRLANAYIAHERPCPDLPPLPPAARFEGSQPRASRKRRFLSWSTPWVTYILTLAQVIVFIYELIRNATLTGSPIEIHPSFNPMIGPSPYVLINLGGRYVPCMRAEAGIQDSSSVIYWPCPNQTLSTPSCTLSDLCGFSGVPNPVVGGSLSAAPVPNQWFRFITPIFIHAGVVHIGFNMMLQILVAREVEITIGHVRFTLVYFASGIFGFIMGGNFAANGIVSTGASGSLFGIIALLLLDLLYTWSVRRSPFRDLIYLVLDIAVSFVLGLLPGLDNFSHIGGFLMGLVLGICVLQSPKALKRTTESTINRNAVSVIYAGQSILPGDNADGTTSENSPDSSGWRSRKHATSMAESFTPSRSSSPQSNLPPHRYPSSLTRRLNPAYLGFTFLRATALAAAVTCCVLLIRAFYAHHSTQCSWCKYLSCLPIRDWCDVGQLTFTNEITGN